MKLRNAGEVATAVIDPRLLDLGKETIEVLSLEAFFFSQSCLHQAPEAKSVVHPHYAATVGAFVMLFMRGH